MNRVLVTALVAASALLVPAAARPATALPLTGYADMIVDPEHGRLYVTGGSGNSSIVVLDFTGSVVTTISGQSGAAGMALDQATSRLYVALFGANSISVIDTDTLTEVTRFSVAPRTPYFLGLAAGKLWFAPFPCPASDFGSSVNLDGTNIQDWLPGCPFATTSANPALLTVFHEVWNVSTIPATVAGTWPNPPGGEGPRWDLVFSASGDRVLTATGAPYDLREYRISDGGLAATYDTGPYPHAVAVSSDGAYVAGALYGAADPDVHVFETGEPTPIRTYSFPYNSYYASLAFSPNGRKLFVVADAFGSPIFHVLSNRIPASLTLNASRSAINYGRSVTLTAHLGPEGTIGRQVSIYATPYRGTKTLVKRGAVDSFGNLTATVRPKKRTTYTARFAGDETYEAATSPAEIVAVRVITSARLSGYYATSGKYKLYHLREGVRQTGKVAPNHAGKLLKFVAQRYRGGAWRTTATGSFRIRSNGSVTAIFTTGDRGSFRARNEFASDRDHLGDVSPWRYFKVTS